MCDDTDTFGLWDLVDLQNVPLGFYCYYQGDGSRIDTAAYHIDSPLAITSYQHDPLVDHHVPILWVLFHQVALMAKPQPNLAP